MNIKNKNVRDWLLASSRHEFYQVINEAKMTLRQTEIIKLKFISCLMNYQIAMKLNISIKTVGSEINKAYQAINRIITKKQNR